MTITQSSLAELAMQKAAKYARLCFRDPHQIQDAISVAWEMAQSGKGTPISIALNAVRRVRSGRQFRQSTRSLQLPERTRQIAKLLAVGEATAEVARKFQISPARVSQMRAELKLNWYGFLE